MEIVRSVYEAWERGDDATGLLDEAIEYVNPPGAVEPGTRRGLAAFHAAVAKTLQGWEFWSMEPEEFRTSGDDVAVTVRYRARGSGSGLEVDGRESALWTVRHGKVVRYEWFQGPLDARKAAGLER